jgi:hypothetical protein
VAKCILTLCAESDAALKQARDRLARQFGTVSDTDVKPSANGSKSAGKPGCARQLTIGFNTKDPSTSGVLTKMRQAFGAGTAVEPDRQAAHPEPGFYVRLPR